MEKKLHKRYLAAIVVMLLLIIATIGRHYFIDNYKVYTSVSSTELSELDYWFKKQGVTSVPVYAIFSGNELISIENKIDRFILGSIKQQADKKIIPDLPIIDLQTREETSFFKELENNKLSVVEIHMSNCPKCEDAPNYKEFYHNQGVKPYRYYIKPDLKQLIKKYN